MGSPSTFGIARMSGHLWSLFFHGHPLRLGCGKRSTRDPSPADTSLPMNGWGWWNLNLADWCSVLRSGDPCWAPTDVTVSVGVADKKVGVPVLVPVVVAGMGKSGASDRTPLASAKVTGSNLRLTTVVLPYVPGHLLCMLNEFSPCCIHCVRDGLTGDLDIVVVQQELLPYLIVVRLRCGVLSPQKVVTRFSRCRWFLSQEIRQALDILGSRQRVTGSRGPDRIHRG